MKNLFEVTDVYETISFKQANQYLNKGWVLMEIYKVKEGLMYCLAKGKR